MGGFSAGRAERPHGEQHGTREFATLGSLDKVVRVVKVLGMVNCASDFTQQPRVINGFSELMVQVFGEKAGKGARSAVGMNAVPNNIAVEIEAIFEVRG